MFSFKESLRIQACWDTYAKPPLAETLPSNRVICNTKTQRSEAERTCEDSHSKTVRCSVVYEHGEKCESVYLDEKPKLSIALKFQLVLTCPRRADRRELFPLPTLPQIPTREPWKKMPHSVGKGLSNSFEQHILMCLWRYPFDTQINAVQGFVQRGPNALSGGDGALWALLLHVCEETLSVGAFFVSLAVLCGNVQAKLLSTQHALHPSPFLGRWVWLCCK